MSSRAKSLSIGLGALVLIGAVVIPLWGPLRTAWRCYALHASAPPERAEVVQKLASPTLALLVVEGPHAGDACTADTSPAHFDALQTGDALDVVVVTWKPGSCELVATLQNSADLLGWTAALLLTWVVGVAGLALFLTRSFTRPVRPLRRLPADPADVRCPACGKAMDEGYLAPLGGIHWRRPEEPLGLPHALSGLPGSVGWSQRPRLHAYRCVPCEVATFQYGKAAPR